MIQLPRPGAPIAEGMPAPLHRDYMRWLRDGLVMIIPERLHPTPVQTSTYTAKPWDLVQCDPSGGIFTVTLPARCEDGAEVGYKNATTSVNAVTFEAASGDTVDEGPSISNSTSRGSERFVFDSARRNWSRM